MSRKLRWGVLGAGQIARVFCNAMRFSASSELVAVASSEPSRAHELAHFSGLSPRVEVNYRHLLDSSDIDAVYVALLNQKAVGLSGTVFVHIALRREEQSELAAFEEAVQDIPEIMECYLMTGEFDYLLRVVVSDMADFERLHNEALTRLPGVARVNSSVAIRTVTKTTELPLG